MGRDVTLYPKKATRDDLKNYLEGLGFEKCEHFWNWPKGTLNYTWFEYKDYRSIDGVSADVYPVYGEESSVTGNEWALHVRNLYSASWHDVKMLNNVLRGARKFSAALYKVITERIVTPLYGKMIAPLSAGECLQFMAM
jgi:hypothetical protein